MLTTYEEDLHTIKQQIKEISTGLLVANELILDAIQTCDMELFTKAKGSIKNIGQKTNSIDNEIIKVLALYSPEARDLRQVVSYLKITNELLRATTNTRSFIKDFISSCKEINKDTLNQYAVPLQISTINAIRIATSMLDIDCADELQDCLNEIVIEENKTDDLYQILEKTILENIQSKDDFKKIHKLLKAFRKSEKIADRSISIANLLLYVKIGGAFKKL